MSLKNVAKNDQSGQALVEYVLILAITVMLILGLMNQFYKPFGDWMKDYMGAYLECLIDVGELPALGFDGGSGECNSKLKGSPGGGGNSPSGSGSRDSSKTAKKPRTDSEDNSSSSSGGGGGNRRNSAEARGFQVGGPKGADGPGSSSAGAGTIVEKLPESQYFRNRGKAYSVAGTQEQSKINGVTGVITVEREKNKREQAKPFTAARTDEIGGDSQKAKKLIVKPGERKIASEEANASWSFSEYLKYGLILIIIVALVLFLAGQVLQISKSMEK